jgi:predicted amidohydrolase
MKVAILQPPYPADGDAAPCIQWQNSELHQLRPGDASLIVLPEYANCAGINDGPAMAAFIDTQGRNYVTELCGQARRLNSAIAAGVVQKDANGKPRNQCVFISPQGELLFAYDKLHLTAAEKEQLGLQSGDEVKVFEWEGVRYAFAICFDIYFPGYFEALAQARPDVIIAPSYQRSESAARIEMLSSCRALDCGATILRSSYAMPDPERGGRSLVALPDGEITANAGAEAGVILAEINPHGRFLKPSSHGRPDVEHRELVISSARPALYAAKNLLAAGRAQQKKAPQLCAHRGLSAVIPENTIPAFAAAISCGAQEIEFDLWLSRDGVPVVCHDPDLNRVAGADLNVMQTNWEEIRTLDTGKFHDPAWTGLKIARFEEVIEHAGNKTIMNIHIKDPGPDGQLVKMVCDLIREHGLINSAYIAGDELVLKPALEYAEEVKRSCLDRQDEPGEQLRSL